MSQQNSLTYIKKLQKLRSIFDWKYYDAKGEFFSDFSTRLDLSKIVNFTKIKSFPLFQMTLRDMGLDEADTSTLNIAKSTISNKIFHKFAPNTTYIRGSNKLEDFLESFSHSNFNRFLRFYYSANKETFKFFVWHGLVCEIDELTKKASEALACLVLGPKMQNIGFDYEYGANSSLSSNFLNSLLLQKDSLTFQISSKVLLDKKYTKLLRCIKEVILSCNEIGVNVLFVDHETLQNTVFPVFNPNIEAVSEFDEDGDASIRTEIFERIPAIEERREFISSIEETKIALSEIVGHRSYQVPDILVEDVFRLLDSRIESAQSTINLYLQNA